MAVYHRHLCANTADEHSFDCTSEGASLERRPAALGPQILALHGRFLFRIEHGKRAHEALFDCPKSFPEILFWELFFQMRVYEARGMVGSDARDILRRELLLAHEPRAYESIRIEPGSTAVTVLRTDLKIEVFIFRAEYARYLDVAAAFVLPSEL